MPSMTSTVSSGPKSVPSSIAETSTGRPSTTAATSPPESGGGGRACPRARQHAERPVGLREALEAELGLHALVESPGPQDLDGAIEVDVGDLTRLDLGLGSDVEGALGLALHGNADTSRPGNKVHGLSQKGLGMSIDREVPAADKLAFRKGFSGAATGGGSSSTR